MCLLVCLLSFNIVCLFLAMTYNDCLPGSLAIHLLVVFGLGLDGIISPYNGVIHIYWVSLLKSWYLSASLASSEFRITQHLLPPLTCAWPMVSGLCWSFALRCILKLAQAPRSITGQLWWLESSASWILWALTFNSPMPISCNGQTMLMWVPRRVSGLWRRLCCSCFSQLLYSWPSWATAGDGGCVQTGSSGK